MDKHPRLPRWAAPMTDHHTMPDWTWEPSTHPDYIWKQHSSGQWHRVRSTIQNPPDLVPRTYQTSRYPLTPHPFDHPSQWQISASPCDKDPVVHAMIRRLLADFGDPWRITWTSMAYQPHGGSFTAARPCNLCHRGIAGARSNQIFMVTTDMFTPRYPPMEERHPLMYHPYTFLATALAGWTKHLRYHLTNATRHFTYPDIVATRMHLNSRRSRLVALIVELEYAVRARIPAYARLSAVQFPGESNQP